MNRQTAAELQKMSFEVRDKVWHHLKRTLLKDTTERKTLERVYEILMSKTAPEIEKRRLAKMLKQGVFTPQKTQEIDARVEREYDECWNAVMARAIKDGRIPPPDRQDRAFAAKMQKRLRH